MFLLSLILFVLLIITLLLTNSMALNRVVPPQPVILSFFLLLMTLSKFFLAVKLMLFMWTSPKRSIRLITPLFYNYLTTLVLAICFDRMALLLSLPVLLCLRSRILFSSVYSFVRYSSRCYYIPSSIFFICKLCCFCC